ncbi:phosphotransferase family protein [Paractinoplanes maris]|uniref:phosphotransferase family protein n=1 Tax=Paractinoplanes maris TaxID=1734446 RepID=UPI0020225102|nr:phosphotransferase [Actinoplanes maris]
MRAFLTVDDVTGLVAQQFGRDRRVAGLDRLTGGTKKGVYRIRLDDGRSVVLYVWADAENYWPESVTVPDDPFTDASGAELFVANRALLAGAGARVPDLLFSDVDRVLVEDVGGETLEARMAYDRAPLLELGRTLRRLHTTFGPGWGRPASVTSPGRPPEEMILGRALAHLDAVALTDGRVAAARTRIEDHLRGLRARVTAREEYAVIHGELGPDHVLISANGEPVMIDIEGVTYFDVEWEHAFLQLRFGPAYESLDPVDLDPARLELYRFAQVIGLIEGPLRIAGTDFPDRQWMLDLAELNIGKALAAVA